MNNTWQHKHKNALSKLMVAGLLFLGLFAFSGLTAQGQVKPGVQRTTLLVSNPAGIVKSINFKNAHGLKGNPCRSMAAVIVEDNRTERLSRQIHICIKNHSSPNSRANTVCFFYRAKTISPDTGDEPAIFLG